MARIIGKPKSVLNDHGQRREAQPPTQTALHEPALPLRPGSRPFLILSGCRWTATGGGQRPVQLARAVKAMGHEVIYASMFDKPSMSEEGVTVTSLQDLGQYLPSFARISSTVFCGFPTAYESIIGLRNWFRVLDLCDDWAEFRAAGLLPGDMWSPRKQQVSLLDSHVTTYSATVLGDIAEAGGAVHRVLIPNAGPSQPLPDNDPPADLLRGKITAVFVGCLWGNWLDWEAIGKLAKDLQPKGGTLNIIGGMESCAAREEFPVADNIRYHGTKLYAEAMRYVAASDVGLIPFKGKALCASVDPVKYYDYIAAGVPIVATDVMTEIAGREYVTLTAPEAMAKAVVKAAKARIPAEYVAEFCERESWTARAEALLACRDIPGVWQQ